MRVGAADVHEAIASIYWVKVPGSRENLPVEPGENPGSGMRGGGVVRRKSRLQKIHIHQTQTGSVAHQIHRVVEVKLGQEVGPVVLHGFLADKEALGEGP